MRELTIDHRTCHLDVLLTGHEHEDISLWARQMNLEHLLDGAVDVVFAR